MAGVALYDLHVKGSAARLALVTTALGTCVLTLGGLLAAFASNANQLNVFANLGGAALAGLGGALVPLSTLPGWARAVAPATPSYWAMRGFRSLILEGGGIDDVLIPVFALLVFAAVFGLIAAFRFRFDEVKSSFL